MGLELVHTKFTDPETGVTSFGKVPKDSLERWQKRGYEEATPEEVAAASRADAQSSPVILPSAEETAPAAAGDSLAVDVPVHPGDGIVVDLPGEPDQDGVAVDAPGDLPPEGVEVLPNADVTAPDPGVDTAGHSTAGDDADSTTDTQSARGGRRR